mgnify:CR=1 FL=1|jgi:ubiquinone/menaquinone biosynthesis C-methylase UbiE
MNKKTVKKNAFKNSENNKVEVKSQDNTPLRLNLACGNVKIEGFVGVDIVKTEAADITVDLEKFPWPWKDESVDEIFCSHYVEHTNDLIKFMDECYRILKPGGKIKIIAPYYNSIRAWQDPTHKRAISEATFLYFNRQWREVNRLDHYSIKSNFDFNYGYDMNPEWASRAQSARDFAIKHYTNVVNDIHVVLEKKQ